jgi:hypothetical protein
MAALASLAQARLLIYVSSMPKLLPTGTKTVRLEFSKKLGFVGFVRLACVGISARIALITRRSQS